jgi:hypothetical protein
MNLAYRQRRTLAVVVGALTAVAVIAAVIRGSGQTVMLVVLTVTLLAAYVVRHQVRARHLYKRQVDSPAAGQSGPVDQPGQPETTTTTHERNRTPAAR